MNKNNNKGRASVIIVLVLLLAAIAGTVVFGMRFMKQNSEEQSAWASTYSDRATPTVTPTAKQDDTEATSESSSEDIEEPSSEETPAATPTISEACPTISGDLLVSPMAYMIRTADGAVVCNKLEEAMIYPASMTKIMTAIIIIENASDLNAKVTVYPEDIDPNYEAGATLAGFEPYEEVTLMDLLYGIMLPSGAEACDAAATAVCQTKDEFVALMNQKAVELGMANTHFSNITGLHADDQISTAHDIATLLTYAIKNDVFRTIASSATYTTSATTQHPEGITLTSTLFSELSATTMINGAVIEGGKTGTTDQAGKCLASFGRFGSYEYVLVTALAPTDQPYNVADAVTAFSALQKG